MASPNTKLVSSVAPKETGESATPRQIPAPVSEQPEIANSVSNERQEDDNNATLVPKKASPAFTSGITKRASSKNLYEAVNSARSPNKMAGTRGGGGLYAAVVKTQTQQEPSKSKSEVLSSESEAASGLDVPRNALNYLEGRVQAMKDMLSDMQESKRKTDARNAILEGQLVEKTRLLEDGEDLLKKMREKLSQAEIRISVLMNENLELKSTNVFLTQNNNKQTKTDPPSLTASQPEGAAEDDELSAISQSRLMALPKREIVQYYKQLDARRTRAEARIAALELELGDSQHEITKLKREHVQLRRQSMDMSPARRIFSRLPGEENSKAALEERVNLLRGSLMSIYSETSMDDVGNVLEDVIQASFREITRKEKPKLITITSNERLSGQRQEISRHNLDYMKQGSIVMKYNYSGGSNPSARVLQLDPTGCILNWRKKNQSHPSSIPVSSIQWIVYGSHTDNFRKRMPEKRWNCLSIVTIARTIDFEFMQEEDIKMWVVGLGKLSLRNTLINDRPVMTFSRFIFQKIRLKVTNQSPWSSTWIKAIKRALEDPESSRHVTLDDGLELPPTSDMPVLYL
jgi:hypothetical protein